MSGFNPENERIKRRHRVYLGEAQRYDEATLDGVDKALYRFEQFTGCLDFKTFNPDQAVAFKRHLAKQLNERTGQPLGLSTLASTLSILRKFFRWLAGQPGFKSRFSYSDADYFNLPEKETRVAHARREQHAPTMEQLLAALAALPANTVIERRDRAVFGLAVLSGARDGALASLRLKHVDVRGRLVVQDAREVRTKNSKTFVTTFFPVPEEFQRALDAWVRELRDDLLWGDDDPLFPATRIVRGSDSHFHSAGVARKAWAGAEPVRNIFRTAFSAAGLPYFRPHSIRKTLALLGERLCRTPEEMKVWSQNFGHENVQTTLASYGHVPQHRQHELLSGMAGRHPDHATAQDDLAALIAEKVTAKIAARGGG